MGTWVFIILKGRPSCRKARQSESGGGEMPDWEGVYYFNREDSC
jgi:hypothetical protein